MSTINTACVGYFPKFKQHTLSLLGELDAVYLSDVTDDIKAKRFEGIFQKYEALP